MKVYKATGRDTYNCRKELKADGFLFDGDWGSWYGDESAVEEFKSRGYRVKVYFEEADQDPTDWYKSKKAGQ